MGHIYGLDCGTVLLRGTLEVLRGISEVLKGISEVMKCISEVLIGISRGNEVLHIY